MAEAKEKVCPECKEVISKVIVVSEAWQEKDLETEDYGILTAEETLYAECPKCGKRISEEDL